MHNFSGLLEEIKPKWASQFIEEPKHDDRHAQTKSTTYAIALLLTGFSVISLTFSVLEYVTHYSSLLLVSIVLWSLTVLLLLLQRPRTFSLLLAALYIGSLLVQTTYIALDHVTRPVWTTISMISLVIALFLVLNLPLRHPFHSRKGIGQPFTSPTAEFRSPEDNLTMWQWMTVSWLAPVINLGAKRQLNDDDIWQLGYEFQHTHLHEAFRKLSGSVLVRLIKANWIDLVLLTLLAFLELAATYSTPLILRKLLQAMKWINVQKRPAIIWALLTLVVEFVSAQSGVFSLWFSRRAYERSRGEMITMLHEKVLNRQILGGKTRDEEVKEAKNYEDLRSMPNDQEVETGEVAANADGQRGYKNRKSGILSATATKFRKLRAIFSTDYYQLPAKKEPASMGKILNLMRNDVYQVSQRFWDFQNLITTPFGLILSLILVWQLVGWASLIGIAVVIAAQVINVVLAKILYSWEKTRRKATDSKLQQISQYVEAIRHLRWYGWHTRKLEKVMEARQKELNLNIITFIWNRAIMFVNAFASGILPVAAFWAYTALAGQKLSVDIAFPALQLFMLLQTNLRDIPNLIKMLLEASVALGRIDDFMVEADVAPDGVSDLADHLECKDASFAWPGVSSNVLYNLNLEFHPGLTLVVGPVASGKTALLQALLGELDLRGGALIRPDAPIGYCSQTPWLESMTIKDNILFCLPYEEERYQHVIEACALLPDLATFKWGDMSPIGENGIGLSGGQKARVALARALYSRAKIILLDDPLSALDQQTAEWIVRRCFQSSLVKERTVILVTHRTDLCESLADQIVEVSQGRARLNPLSHDAAKKEAEHSHPTSARVEVKTSTDTTTEIRGKFEDEEYRAYGGVPLKVYWEYVKAGKLPWWFLVFLSVMLWRFFDYAQSWFLKEWGEAYRDPPSTTPSSDESSNVFVALQTLLVRANTASPLNWFFAHFPDPGLNPHPWLFWLMMICIFQAIAVLTLQVFMLVVTYTAGKNMFIEVMIRISNATFLFYDVTPIGRLMNRLTGDMGTVDGQIANEFLYVLWEIVAWASSVIIIASVTPPFLLFSLVLTATFVYIFFRFLPASQSLRRLEMVSLSPLMSNFGALLTGLMTVRAFHMQPKFQDRVIRVTDSFQKMDHFYWSLQSWLQYRFDCLSAISTFLLTLLAVYSSLTPGLTAFVLIAAQRFVQSTHRICKQYGKLQLDFVSVERVVEFLHLDQEDPGQISPPAHWPSLSPLSSNSSKQPPAIEFRNVTIRYAPHLPPALNHVSFSIPAGSSVAVIGRTGSGKSTLALSLLATIAPEPASTSSSTITVNTISDPTPSEAGAIFISGIDINKVNKIDLRSRITFLAQDPILFEGTLRTNIDPMSDYSDTECTQVINRILEATSTISGFIDPSPSSSSSSSSSPTTSPSSPHHTFNWTLQTPVHPSGHNLSQGQRQLVGLARAILRRSAIIIMDEATASVDLDTSWAIQKLLKEELRGSTVITIAHRASAVRDCDLVVKLEEGRVVAFGKPEDVEGEVGGMRRVSRVMREVGAGVPEQGLEMAK